MDFSWTLKCWKCNTFVFIFCYYQLILHLIRKMVQDCKLTTFFFSFAFRCFISNHLKGTYHKNSLNMHLLDEWTESTLCVTQQHMSPVYIVCMFKKIYGPVNKISVLTAATKTGTWGLLNGLQRNWDKWYENYLDSLDFDLWSKIWCQAIKTFCHVANFLIQIIFFFI